MSHGYLFDIAIILLSTKIFGLITRKLHMPQVVGALLAGLILGPAVLNILHETEFIKQLSSLGVIILIFNVGMESNLEEIKKSGKASVLIALLGMIIPLLCGIGIGYYFGPDDSSINQTLQYIFIGVILTATSVSITCETLKELGRLNSKAGNAILTAAIIDDILGVIALTLVTSMSDSSVSVLLVLLKVILFFAFSIVLGIIFFKLFGKWVNSYNKDLRRFVIIAFVLCLSLSFIAEEFFGIADITGAFIAGLMLSGNKESHYIATRFETLSYMLLSPIFFASIGLTIEIPELSWSLVTLTVVMTIVAVISKLFGCGLGAKLCGYTNKEAMQIGTGMVSRGEVALIVASKGIALGLMTQYFLAPIVIMVLITTIFTPILLKFVFSDKTVKVVS